MNIFQKHKLNSFHSIISIVNIIRNSLLNIEYFVVFSKYYQNIVMFSYDGDGFLNVYHAK